LVIFFHYSGFFGFLFKFVVKIQHKIVNKKIAGDDIFWGVNNKYL